MTKARLENLIPHVNVRKRCEITRHCWRRVSGKVLCLGDRAGTLRDMRRRGHDNPELLTERDMSDQCARRPTTSLRLALWSRGTLGWPRNLAEIVGPHDLRFTPTGASWPDGARAWSCGLDRSVILCSKTKRRAVSGKNRQIRNPQRRRRLA